MTADPINEPYRIGPQVVPGIWRFLLPPGLKDLRLPAETRATCASCPRIASDHFRPDYRCCTYHPRVPNFMLGLAVALPSGRAKLEQPAVARGLMPEGFQPSPAQWSDFLVDVGEERFGKSTKVLCPFLQQGSGLCGIYQFRNSVCSTYFCHFDQGKNGERFWESLQTLVMQVELILGQWSLRQAGFDVDAYVIRLNELANDPAAACDQKIGGWTEAARRHVWGDQFGRELEVYAECGRHVRENRDHLWKIANREDIIEADRFENAAQTLVPPEHQDQIEDDFADPERETVAPRDLWRTVKRRHQKMWSQG